ncbi:RNA polymerase sigma factor [Actinomadura rudentiformis]|uniref:Sigma-70 family RNA polymerase sigma factor n=1 Tax=Actinomadura rudentiformis TaxID=359158 RepID=A0A6H9YLB9_9ACTN|nr:sigma-70 family RNA polymerase sigma factor [Actinomadura rudentiformis]KAB2347299.1 sigma-70 family RNA polymerase sigma factor [Actinomadura rudentiformis]
MTPDEFTATYREHYPRLVNLARRIVGDQATAEDVAQDAFVALLKATLHDEQTVPRFLSVAVKNRSRDVLRHRKVAHKYAPFETFGPLSAEYALSVALFIDIIAALRTLPASQRRAIVLRTYAGLSEAEIADRMGWARGTVKSHTARARASLRRELAEVA